MSWSSPRRCAERAEHSDADRGVSLSVFVAALVPLLIVVVGFVVDTASRVAAARQVSIVAAQAARAGSDASSADRLVGGSGAESAVSAARQVLAAHSVTGDVHVQAGELVVHTSGSSRTLFLSVLGIDHFTVSGEATANLVRVP